MRLYIIISFFKMQEKNFLKKLLTSKKECAILYLEIKQEA
jgi:hypothetical protein